MLLLMSQRPAYNSTYVGCLALLYLTLTDFYNKNKCWYCNHISYFKGCVL